MRKNGLIVPPLSKNVIYSIADSVRGVFASLMDASPYVPIDRVYEVLSELMDGFSFEVVTYDEIGDDHGRTYPDKKLIQIREDVYVGACCGNGRDRFTMAHELGHLFLHQEVRFSRSSKDFQMPIYTDSEWQADTFASGFLVDSKYLPRCYSVREVSDMFGISISAAKCRFNK